MNSSKVAMLGWSLLWFFLSVVTALSTHFFPRFVLWPKVIGIIAIIVFSFVPLIRWSKSTLWKGLTLMLLSIIFSLGVIFQSVSWFGKHQVIDTASQSLSPFSSSVQFTNGNLQPKATSFEYTTRLKNSSPSKTRIYVAPFVFEGEEKIKYFAVNEIQDSEIYAVDAGKLPPFFDVWKSNPNQALVYRTKVYRVEYALQDLSEKYDLEIDEDPIFLQFVQENPQALLSTYRKRFFVAFLILIVVMSIVVFLPEKKKIVPPLP